EDLGGPAFWRTTGKPDRRHARVGDALELSRFNADLVTLLRSAQRDTPAAQLNLAAGDRPRRAVATAVGATKVHGQRKTVGRQRCRERSSLHRNRSEVQARAGEVSVQALYVDRPGSERRLGAAIELQRLELAVDPEPALPVRRIIAIDQ